MKTQFIKGFLICSLIAYIGTFMSCSEPEKDYNKLFTEFLQNYETNKIIPLEKKVRLAEFEAAQTGNDEDYELSAQLNIELTQLYSNKEEFALLKEIKESGKITDPYLSKQLDIIYCEYHFHQIEEAKMAEMINKANDLQQKFSVFRAQVDSSKLSDVEINEILSASTNLDQLENVWKASKKIGNEVAEGLIELVKMRNEGSKALGFENYYVMRLKLSGQEPAEVERIYNELDILTKELYAELKYSIDDYLTQKLGIKATELRPWHYQNLFFQEAPDVYKVNFDGFYKDLKVEEIAAKFFNGIGLPIENILTNSDLYPKAGKSQAGQVYNIDRSGDVRILANLSNNAASMYTILYEAGFAAYLKNINNELPYTLRDAAHFSLNDAIATMFGRFNNDPVWMVEILGTPERNVLSLGEAIQKNLRLEKFIFSRWAQVMYRFEKSMYENPAQDLNTLWWDLVEKYQLIHRPDNRNEPDWAAKSHLINLPCTYHNYMLGELMASQIFEYMNVNLTKPEGGKVSWSNNPEIGKYLTEKIFSQGRSLSVEEILLQATGEKLNPLYFKEQYIK